MVTLFLVNSAAAFELMATAEGVPMQWHEMPVAYSWLDSDAPDLPGLQDAIHGAFETWADTEHSDIRVEDAGLNGPPEVALDSIDAIFFDTEWPLDEPALALATTWTNTEGKIVAFDIHVNPHVDWATDDRPDAYDLQAALTHEVGHVLGVDHSTQEDATMYARQGHGDGYRRALHTDDRAAVQHLYGDDARNADATRANVLPPVLACGSTGLGAVGALPLLLALAGVRRRRTAA